MTVEERKRKGKKKRKEEERNGKKIIILLYIYPLIYSFLWNVREWYVWGKNYRIRKFESFFPPLPRGKRGNCRRKFGVATIKGKFGGWFYVDLCPLSPSLSPSFFTVYRSFLFFFLFFLRRPIFDGQSNKKFSSCWNGGVLFYANKLKRIESFCRDEITERKKKARGRSNRNRFQYIYIYSWP